MRALLHFSPHPLRVVTIQGARSLTIAWSMAMLWMPGTPRGVNPHAFSVASGRRRARRHSGPAVRSELVCELSSPALAGPHVRGDGQF
jgi:hypothetical protein